MKKLDKLILSSFIGPFILTFLVVVFILLTQHMLKYFDDIIGKGLGIDVIGQLLFYFAIFMTPIAMPLAVLLSSLIAFGNLGEHFELTAVKSAGISLVRTLLPIFFFVVMLTGIAFYVNNNLVPKAALEAYSLLYDIKQKKPALDLQEGAFYDGIPNMSIKVNRKFPDGVTIKDIIIYDHRKHDGNSDVTKADSGKMYTILNEQYLKLELYNGYNYTEGANTNQQMTGRVKSAKKEVLSRTKFTKTQVVFDLSSFALERTDKKWFQGNRIMRNLVELENDIDSIDNEVLLQHARNETEGRLLFSYYRFPDSLGLKRTLNEFRRSDTASATKQDSSDIAKTFSSKLHPADLNDSLSNKQRARKRGLAEESRPKRQGLASVKPIKVASKKKAKILPDSAVTAKIDSLILRHADRIDYDNAANKARSVKTQLVGNSSTMNEYANDRKVFQIQWHKILASSLACITMFLIGAPLGAIIKKGGLGVPFLVSIMFFIIYYLLTMTGEKWAKQGIIGVQVGVWAADLILFVVGLVFLRQARLDARLFEADFYRVLIDKVNRWFIKKRLVTVRQNN